jgi:alginate O-acetyltransferase complex protein AlgI
LTLLDPRYWVLVLATVLLVPLSLRVPRSTVFGALNLVALYVLLGGSAAAFVALLATGVWLGSKRRAVWPLLAGVALFLLYKLTMERGAVAFGSLTLSRRDGALFSLMAAVGFSYVFLRLWDLVVTVRQGRLPLLDPLSLAGYLCPFHMLSAGPIGSYTDHVAMNAQAAPPSDFDSLLGGVNDIATGFFYKFVVAEGIRIFAFGLAGPMVSRGWSDTALLIVYVFFDFAGYSRVALAVGRLAGVPTPVNFSAPFASTSVTEFWTRWHMSLGAFVRRNLYLPAQLHLVRRFGVQWAYLATVASLALSFLFVGMWHRLSIRFLLWGAGMGTLLAVEKLLRDRVLMRWAGRPGLKVALRLAGPAYVFLVLTISLHLVIGELIRP